MPRFADTFRERVRSASDIVEVIGSYVPLKRAGANFVALCPFHKEKTPSFNVNPHKQIFHCFGCQKGGDVFAFVQAHENISFPEAVERLAERARIPVEYVDGPADSSQRSLRDSLLKLHEAITQRWQQCLQSESAGQVAREYLTKRGVTPDAVREFRIGAAPDAWDDSVNWAKAKGVDLALLEQAGLVIRRDNGGYYDRFRGRLMFPICDDQGRVIAFSGRVLVGDEKQAKYVNSPETPIFSKGRVLFALDKAKRAILDAGNAVICEGQLDTIACHAAGICNVVAPQGTALTSDHTRILKRYVDEVILCFDSDKAGRSATVRVLDDLLASGLAIRVATVPAPEDPDSFIRQQGAEAFRQILNRAEGFFDYYLRQLMAENEVSTDRGRLTVLKTFGEAVRKSGNAVLIDTYAQKLAQRLGVDTAAVRNEFRKMPTARTNPTRTESTDAASTASSSPPARRPPPTELWLIKLMLSGPEPLEDVLLYLDPHWITHPVARRIIEAAAAEKGSIANLLARFTEDESACSLVTEAASEKRSIPHREQQFRDVIQRLRNEAMDREIIHCQTQLADPQLPEETRQSVLTRQLKLLTAKRLPLAPLGES